MRRFVTYNQHFVYTSLLNYKDQKHQQLNNNDIGSDRGNF